jgi:hypothetical protein
MRWENGRRSDNIKDRCDMQTGGPGQHDTFEAAQL